MSNEIRAEFEEFISELSKEICKEVLLEDLKLINESFSKTSEEYSDLHNKYSDNIKAISEDMEEINRLNSQTKDLILELDYSNDLIKASLDIIHGGHEKVLKNIIEDNKKIFEEYNDKLSELNDSERNKLIVGLKESINDYSKDLIIEIKNVLDINRIAVISKDVNRVLNEMDFLNSEIEKIKIKQKELSQTIDKRINNIEESLSKDMKKILIESNKNKDYLGKRIIRLAYMMDKANKKNNFIIISLFVVVFIFIIV